MFSKHLRDSGAHNFCPECSYDATFWYGLSDHCRDRGSCIVSDGCTTRQELWCPDSYRQHVQDANFCRHCDRHYEPPSNLTHWHKLTHCSPQYECSICPRQFTTYGRIMIHYEAGHCTDAIRVNELVARCYQWPSTSNPAIG
ncbi:hypothetical protein BCR34DRAFT_643442 [Clohesyomyces aquaticus]|uniref:C2H2-type domain-containing protein n=1 Tax=Clohesyomyces aquaticus TaxID=1231657 RepID=A0A1Y1ZYJ9_9PLEO|nr:hypothetical protein BCR34DRAFT_643442 [Clohesyomyces aquaticus]